jgi:hypothetical protein
MRAGVLDGRADLKCTPPSTIISRMRTAIALVFLAMVAACGSNSKVGAGGGTNYSSAPCADNCGQDAQCMSNCQGVNNQQPLPAGVQAGPHH